MTNPYPTSGSRKPGVSRSRQDAHSVPDEKAVTAVFGICFVGDQIVIAKERDKRQLLGGHVEIGESLEEALSRECLEEGGYHVSHANLLGYKHITSDTPTPNKHTGGYYPHPDSYMPIYICKTQQDLSSHTCHEIDEVQLIGKEDIEILGRDAFLAYAAFTQREQHPGR